MTDRVTEVLIAALMRALGNPTAEWRLCKSGKLDGGVVLYYAAL